MATLPPPARPLVAPKVPPPKPRGTAARGFGATSRRTRWWLAPAVQGTVFTVCATYLFISGVLLTPLFDTPYEVDGYLSPLFSPLIVLPFLPAWFSPAILDPVGSRWLPGDLLLLPQGLLPLLLRRPPGLRRGRAVASPAFSLAASVTFLFQNLHRYFLYLAFIPLVVLWVDAFTSFRLDGAWRIGLGTVILTVNAALLTGYSLSCHSLRHLVGGKIDCFSCSRNTQIRHGLWQRLTSINRHHMAWAWASLLTVTFADVYVRLLALGVITDPAIHF